MRYKPFTVELVSVTSNGAQGNDASGLPDISADGRFVTFGSFTTNLVPGDANNTEDIFVHDLRENTTEIVSVGSNGEPGNAQSSTPAISGDGSFVTFYSYASNLAAGDEDNISDIFLRDRRKDSTELISVASNGDKGNAPSFAPDISAGGRYVAYESEATNLVPGDDNGFTDVFVHNRRSGATEIVSVSSNGDAANDSSFDASISADGRYVAFISFASNLAPGDGDNDPDIYVHDRRTGITQLVSVASNGDAGNGASFQPEISANGRYVTFVSEASNLVPGDTNNTEDIFVHDLRKGTTELVSVASEGDGANGISSLPSISGDGRYVTYASDASNLVRDDTNGLQDVFVFDRRNDTTRRISVTYDGEEANGYSSEPAISDNGRHVTFVSAASNLVPDDTNGSQDVFVARTYDWLV